MLKSIFFCTVLGKSPIQIFKLRSSNRLFSHDTLLNRRCSVCPARSFLNITPPRAWKRQYSATASKPQAAKESNTRKKHVPYPALPEIPEDEIEEKFVRGTGPGGQKINKTSIVAQLKHRPTGIQVSCQETRSLQQNRTIARKRLREKVDAHLNGDDSRVMTKMRETIRKKRSADKKKSKKYRILEEAKNATASPIDG